MTKAFNLLRAFIEANPDDVRGWRGYWLGLCSLLNPNVEHVENGQAIIEEAAELSALNAEAEHSQRQVKMLRLTDQNVLDTGSRYLSAEEQFNFISEHNRTAVILDWQAVASVIGGVPYKTIFLTYTGKIDVLPDRNGGKDAHI